MKKPTVFAGSFVPRGLMEILLSVPSSAFTSMASSSNFNLTKQSLEQVEVLLKICWPRIEGQGKVGPYFGPIDDSRLVEE